MFRGAAAGAERPRRLHNRHRAARACLCVCARVCARGGRGLSRRAEPGGRERGGSAVYPAAEPGRPPPPPDARAGPCAAAPHPAGGQVVQSGPPGSLSPARAGRDPVSVTCQKPGMPAANQREGAELPGALHGAVAVGARG